MSEDEDGVETESLSTVIDLPAEQKAQLKLLCTRRGISMRDYVERLVQAGLALGDVSGGRAEMSGAAAHPPSEFDEVRYCKYGCNYHTKNKSGLAQHEATCIYQRSRRAQERAEEIETERRIEQAVLA